MGRKNGRPEGRDWQVINARFSRRDWQAVLKIRSYLEDSGKSFPTATISSALRFAVRHVARIIDRKRKEGK